MFVCLCMCINSLGLLALSIFTLLTPCLRTICQKLGFKLAQSCSTSWDLQTHMLSMFAEASSTIARLWLPTLPIMEGLKDITKDREACIYTNCWVLSVIYDLHAFVMQ